MGTVGASVVVETAAVASPVRVEGAMEEEAMAVVMVVAKEVAALVVATAGARVAGRAA